MDFDSDALTLLYNIVMRGVRNVQTRTQRVDKSRVPKYHGDKRPVVLNALQQ